MKYSQYNDMYICMYIWTHTLLYTSNAVCKRRHGCVGVVSLDVPCKTDVQDAVMEEFEEFDEDGLVDSDDDDNSWKVRRAALKAGTAGTAGTGYIIGDSRRTSRIFEFEQVVRPTRPTLPVQPHSEVLEAMVKGLPDRLRPMQRCSCHQICLKSFNVFHIVFFIFEIVPHSHNMPQPHIGAFPWLQKTSFCLVQQSSCLEISASFHVTRAVYSER